MLSFVFPQMFFFSQIKGRALCGFTHQSIAANLSTFLDKDKPENDSKSGSRCEMIQACKSRHRSRCCLRAFVCLHKETVSPGHMTQALKQMRAEREEEGKSRVYDYCCTEGSKSEDKELGGGSKYKVNGWMQKEKAR